MLRSCFDIAGKFALGSGRKKERSKQKVIPDMFAKGAIVWNVQVNSYKYIQAICFIYIIF